VVYFFLHLVDLPVSTSGHKPKGLQDDAATNQFARSGQLLAHIFKM